MGALVGSNLRGYTAPPQGINIFILGAVCLKQA